MKLVELYTKRNLLKEHIEDKYDQNIKNIEQCIAEEACKIIDQETAGLNFETGGYNAGHLWKLKNKIIPKPKYVPTAMKLNDGTLLTGNEEIKEATLDHYEHVLRNRSINDGLEDQKQNKDNLCKTRLEITNLNKTPNWTRAELEVVLKGLKKKKSRDPNKYANEIFDPTVAGDDLIEAILALMNRIKSDQIYPECMEYCNITSIYKQKGPVNSFDSYRGVFRVQALRNILEKLIYNDEYPNIDTNLTDCNVGARKGRNIRDNIFVLNAKMNNAVQGTKEALDISIYDAEKCFLTHCG